ncbi:MAG: IS200/IS605 family transposase [Candidatus Hydrogenedentes bacterium]|nr:IS200/IS605 family transposase [Candidatus Hydrogenedentota bacterium]
MSSTYLNLHYHIIFGTKNRRPYIDDKFRGRIHAYLGGTLKKLGCVPQKIGGTQDHVHILTGLKATHCLSDVMRELKKNTSIWVHKEIGIPEFQWQDGYAAFTVSATACSGVKRYIDRQKEHHRQKTFKEELAELLEMAGIEYDPKYLD